jgi:hypothetical protein
MCNRKIKGWGQGSNLQKFASKANLPPNFTTQPKMSAAAVWNNLPDSIRCCTTFDSLKRSVKTYLFKLAFTI